MKEFPSVESARGNFGPCALAIGNFDGVHIGHQALIGEAVRYASSHGIAPAALTFHPHPTAVVAPQHVPPLICSLERRIQLLAAAGAERILVLPFTPEVARMSPEEFVSKILIHALETKAVFVGENFHFGHKQSGTPDVLRALGKQYGFHTRFLRPLSLRGEVVSSSAVRRYLTAGNVSRAGRLLGRCFSLEGHVVAGHGVGSKQTVPTLNLRPEPERIVPRGVYVTETIEPSSNRRWESITNAGFRPTFGGDELTVETFLLGKLEGEAPREIEVRFHHFVRAERQFPNPEALKQQIFKDVSVAQKYWRRRAKMGIPAASIY
jgi:riboflavin kinase/FMN adenylyltransferase